MAEDKIDLIFATETHLDGEKDEELELGEYNLYRRDRPVNGKLGGGVMLAIRKSLDSELISVGTHAETVFCKINRKGKPPIVAACVYRPTNNDTEISAAISRDILEAKSKFKNSEFFIGGDFNLPDINWFTLEIKGGRYKKQISENILDACNDSGLSQIVDEPTRGENILDIFLTSNPNLVTKAEVVSGFSDHEAVKVHITLQLKRKKQVKRLIKLWKKVNLSKLKKDTKAFATLFLATHKISDPVDQIWECIKNNLLLIIEDNVPTKLTSSKTHKPWINTETKRLLRQKQRWYTKAKTSKLESDWTRYKEIKKLTQTVCRQTQNKFVQDLISDDKDNKKFWAHIRSKNKDKTGIADLKSGDTLIQNPKTKANLFNKFFTTVFSNPDPKDTQQVEPNPSHPMPKNTIKKAGVLKFLQNLKADKATGPV